jgi:small subunit ribosomal protein S8
MTDPLADGLTRIRNASRVRHVSVDLAPSSLVARVLDVLKQEGFIRSYKPLGQTPAQRRLRVYLKYARRTPAIRGIVRVSRPGQRIYRPTGALPRVLRGLGLAVVTTSRGVMSGREAFRQRLGGEILCYIW